LNSNYLDDPTDELNSVPIGNLQFVNDSPNYLRSQDGSQQNIFIFFTFSFYTIPHGIVPNLVSNDFYVQDNGLQLILSSIA
jgi:hypothetical protein